MSVNRVKPLYILDTNIWLDWLVFSDEAIKPLQALHAAGQLDIVYTSDMRVEFLDVISRAHFKLSIEQQILVDKRMQQIAREVPAQSVQPSIRCQDRDDQIFIDAALAYAVDWLLTKDHHLLDLRKRAAKQGVRVGTLLDWARAYPTAHELMERV
ncbi:PIN domain-containing protein [Hydromonas duriensis]|uniref:Putative nucleic acid-binding protein n=1 Tax=Hydromonas duriensis TaxID=1527608 RepID=A0A4R6YBD1_9BURK|nr:PIN domain-containing protein [Hydromonas duriensis]TDR32967.1 putative nucleic acid-binding protein [Hydromonas duriensis]